MGHAAIAVQIITRGHPGIGAQGEYMRVIQTSIFDPVAQGCKRHQAMIIIDFLQYQNIRGNIGDYICHRPNLRVLAFENVAQKQAGAFALQACVERGNAVSVSECRFGNAQGDSGNGNAYQAFCQSSVFACA